MRRARRSRPTLLRVTLADGVAPPACGDRWSTSGKIQAGALIRLRDRATVILKVFRDYNPWQGFHIDVRSEVGRSRSAFVCDFGVTRPASRVAWVIPGLWPFVAQLTKSLVIVFPRKAQKARNGDREWRFVVASISRRLVTLPRRAASPPECGALGDRAPPCCGARWSRSSLRNHNRNRNRVSVRVRMGFGVAEQCRSRAVEMGSTKLAPKFATTFFPDP